LGAPFPPRQIAAVEDGLEAFGALAVTGGLVVWFLKCNDRWNQPRGDPAGEKQQHQELRQSWHGWHLEKGQRQTCCQDTASRSWGETVRRRFYLSASVRPQ